MQATQFKIFEQPVQLDDKGLFRVTLATGEKLKAQSILALNRKASKTLGFDAFPVLMYHRYDLRKEDKPFEVGTVVGTKKAARGYYPDNFVLADGKVSHIVVLDNPENRKRLTKIHALKSRKAILEGQITEIENELDRRDTRGPIAVQAA